MSHTEKASVVLVGCGCPLRSMGWYHAVQLLDGRCPSATLRHVVEPFYMKDAAKGIDPAGYDTFQQWKESKSKEGISFYADVVDVPAPADGEHRLGIISARTSDNPELLVGCVDIGCKSIYLEKPGAPTVAELEAMRDKAASAGCKVYMGFNKNVSSYLQLARDHADKIEKCDLTFLHNNAYTDSEADLSECFERNAEGMLKNMAIHELAILVTFYGVSVSDIASVKADKEFSSCKTLKGPSSGKSFTDFDKLKFLITTKAGVEVSVAADRCGGDDSVGIVTDAATGVELARYTMPDDDAVANIPNLEEKYPGAMPYFFTQDPDYQTLKERVARNCVDGTQEAEGVATIDVAIETLKVAEYLTPILQEQLLK